MSNFEAQIPKKTRIETKLYQADPTNMNSYIHQQSLPKNKEIFPWILHKLDTQSKNSRPYHQPESIIIPLESTEPLQDPRPHPKAKELSQTSECSYASVCLSVCLYMHEKESVPL